MTIKLIAGLGNPGIRYTQTRHNAGFLVVDALAQQHNLSFKHKRLYDEAKTSGLHLIKPTTFMNLSGQAIQAAMTQQKIRPEELLVIHDDLDIPLGKLRFKAGGSGAGGQRGVADTINRIGPNFTRLKIGIGRPPQHWTTQNWVLSKFQATELELLTRVIDVAVEATGVLVAQGLDAAMAGFNGLDLSA